MLDERLSDGQGSTYESQAQQKLSDVVLISYSGTGGGIFPPYGMTVFADGSVSAEDGNSYRSQRRYLTPEQAEDLAFRLYSAISNAGSEEHEILGDCYFITAFEVTYQGRKYSDAIYQGCEEFPKYIKEVRDELENMWAVMMGRK